MENATLIKRIAWSFHRTSKLDYDDLCQEAYLSFLMASSDYDSSKGSLSTYTWHVVTTSLKNYVRKEHKINGHICSIEDNKVDLPVEFAPLCEKLCKEAQEISQIIHNTSKKFAAMDPTEAIQKIKKILINKGWPPKKIQQGIKNLEILSIC